jgi:hypothetical protein
MADMVLNVGYPTQDKYDELIEDKTAISSEYALTAATIQQFLYEIQQQPSFRDEMDKAAAYYDDRQVSPEKAAILKARGQSPSIQNLIKPIINSVLGTEAKTRRNWNVESEYNDTPTDLAIAINVELHKVAKETRADRAFSDAYASMIKTGIGWIHVGRSSDPFGSPYRVEFIHRNEMFWDFRTRLQDMSDCRYIVRRRRYDIDIALSMFPQASEEINRYINYDRGQSWDVRQRGSYSSYSSSDSMNDWLTFDDFELISSNRRTVPIYEVWYRQLTTSELIKAPRRKPEVFDTNNPKHQQLLSQGIMPFAAQHMEIRRCVWVASKMILDEPSPYKHRNFPYVKMTCLTDDSSGAPYGLIKSAIPMQDCVNDRLFKMNHLLASKSIVYTNGIIKDPNKVRLQASSPTAMIELDAKAAAMNGARFDIQDNTPIAREQLEIYLNHKETINQVMGVYSSMLGADGEAKSGVHAGMLIEQSATALAEPNDNAEFARQLMGELLLSLVLEDLEGERNYVVDTEEEKRIDDDAIILNKEVIDELTGEVTLENDTSKINVKVSLGEVPATASYKQQQQQMLGDLIKSLPPDLQALLIPFVIEQSDLNDRQEMADLIRKATGQSSEDEQPTPEQQAQQQAEQQAQELAMQLQQAQLDKAKADAEKVRADAELIKATTVVKNVEALFSSVQAGASIVTTPSITPIADSIFMSAGGQDKNDAPLIQDPIAQGLMPMPVQPVIDSPQEELQEPPVQQTAAEENTEIPTNTSPLFPAKPQSPALGMKHGIETQRNEGVVT